jgi:hypothetical protein
MRSLFKTSTAQPRRVRKAGVNYGTLEQRCVLTTTSAFVAATGTLNITLTQDTDTAIVDVVDNNVTINGNDQVLGSIAGTLAADAVRQITVSGVIGAPNQSLVLDGNFTDAAGRDLDNVSVNNINEVSVFGDYEIDGAFTANLDGTGGGIADGPTDASGSLVVGGTTTINAGSNVIRLDNTANDFNLFNATTTGSFDNDIIIGDANTIQFSGIQSAGDLIVEAGGFIGDIDGADIIVARDGRFTGTSITLGSDTQTTNFFRTAFTASGTVELQEDSNVILLTTDVQSLRVTSPGGIFDGTRTSINVQGLAELNGNNRIRLGDNGIDSFNAGSVTFNSNGHVSISERSSTTIVGENRGLSWTSRSIGDITNGVGATIDIVRQTGLAANNVFLGNQAGDNVETGALFFFATDRFDLEADSDLVIIERKNEAGVLDLSSTGTITDDDRAYTRIRGLARFTAESVDLGDTRDDQFNAGAIEFETETTFRLNENSSTNIVGTSEAGLGSSVINSAGDITNSASATVDVEGAIGFFGDNINLGNQANDDFRFGVLTFNTAVSETGVVDITEDDSTLINGSNTASVLRIQSLGAIEDGQQSTVNVSGNSRFTALNNDQIVLGDQGDIFAGGVDTGQDFDAIFNTGSLTVATDGDVSVEEDSVILLTGDNRANNLTLNAGLGQFNIGDTQFANIAVAGTLDVTGALVNLGTGVDPDTGETTDNLTLAGLRFNTTGNTNISADSGFELVGDSCSDELLILNSTGQITADVDATFAAMDTVSLNDIDGEFDFEVAAKA